PSLVNASGGLVDSVVNVVNPSIPFIASGSARPTTGSRTLGGWNAFNFDGSANFLTANGLAALFTGSDKAMTVFVVCECDNVASAISQTQWALGYSVTTNPIFYSYYLSNNNAVTRRDDAGLIITNNLGLVAGVNVNCTVFTGTTYSSYTNATTNASGAALDVGNLTLDRFAIGALVRSTNAQFFDGVIGEVIVFEGALSTADRLMVQRYLGNKYGAINP
ncbi:MAG: hypothetical protein KA100_06940, partial [Rickettsiales bacterium]|nr:hypothetical protein [Rickettsiales bacterium]